MKKLLYVCEADSGGIMEYAIRQSAALARAGVEVHFLCKSSFPIERSGEGIRVWEFNESRGTRGQRRGPLGKILRIWRMISDLRSEAKQVAEIAEELATKPNSAELTTEDTIEHRGRCEKEQPQVGPKGERAGALESKSTEEEAGLHPGFRVGASESDSLASRLADSHVSESLIGSADGPASEFSTRHSLPVTRHNLDEAEVAVLFACYKEYFALFWVWPLRRLAKKGIAIGTIAHDPVRDFVVGPLWWHRWSVRLGYSFVRDVFVHDDTPVDFGGKKPAGIRVHQIPHGPYEVAKPKIGREVMRRRLGFDSGLTTEGTESSEEEGKDLSHGGTANTERVGKEAGLRPDSVAGASELDSLASKRADAPLSESLTRSASIPASAPATSYPLPATPASPDIVFLAFGQIRDGKNLDLFLRAMTRLPENVKLLVAGKGDSGSSRPPEYYQKLAEELGVGGRCRWDIRRISDEEVGNLFAACDVVLVTYSAKFRSASGVLNASVSARKPVLASCGGGPLKSVVGKYNLGVFVEPDDIEELLRGASKFVPNSATVEPATRYPLPATAPQALSLDSGRSIATVAPATLAIRAASCRLPRATPCAGVIDSPTPAWERYERENSWEQNARKVVEVFEA